MAKVYAGDVGTVIRLDVGVDITGATAEIRVLFGTKNLVWAATVNGQFVEYITLGTTADIAKAGKYKMQAFVNTGAWVGLGETVTLKVSDKFK